MFLRPPTNMAARVKDPRPRIDSRARDTYQMRSRAPDRDPSPDGRPACKINEGCAFLSGGERFRFHRSGPRGGAAPLAGIVEREPGGRGSINNHCARRRDRCSRSNADENANLSPGPSGTRARALTAPRPTLMMKLSLIAGSDPALARPPTACRSFKFQSGALMSRHASILRPGALYWRIGSQSSRVSRRYCRHPDYPTLSLARSRTRTRTRTRTLRRPIHATADRHLADDPRRYAPRGNRSIGRGRRARLPRPWRVPGSRSHTIAQQSNAREECAFARAAGPENRRRSRPAAVNLLRGAFCSGRGPHTKRSIASHRDGSPRFAPRIRKNGNSNAHLAGNERR